MRLGRPSSLFAVVGMVLSTATMLVVGAGVASADNGSWAATGSLNQPRITQTQTLLNTGKVLVAGGRSATAALTSAELYDPVSGSFTLTGPMTTGRWSHTATLLPDGRVLVAGGFTAFITASNAQPVTDTAEIYNPATGLWTSTPPMVTRRALHNAALLTTGPNAGKVLVAGGRTCTGPPPAACDFTVRTNTAELYDPATNTWAPTGAMNKPRHTTSAVALFDGRVLVPAGFSGADPHDTDNTADIYNPATGTWSLTGNLNRSRARQGAMLLPDGTVLVGPGSRATTCGPPVCQNGGPPFSAVINDTTEIYNPATNTWTLTANPLLPGRFNFQQAVLPNGRALIAGGFGGPAGGEALQTSAEVYNPVTGTWSPSAPTGMTHQHGSSSALANTHDAVVLTVGPCGANCGKVLVLGDNLTDPVADLYTPEMITTAEVKVLCAPFVNFAAGMSYKCEVMVAAGGTGGALFAPTGKVDFHLGSVAGTKISSCTLIPTPGPGGISTCRVFNTTPIPNGVQTIVAAYSGGNHPAATGSDVVGAPLVTPHPSDTAVLCAPTSTGGAAKCFAAVADDDRGNHPEPMGAVNLTVSGAPVGTCTLTPIGGAGGLTDCLIITTVPVTSGSTVVANYVPSVTIYAPSSDSDVVG